MKTKLRRLLAILLSFTMILVVLSGCGKDKADGQPNNNPETSDSSENPEESDYQPDDLTAAGGFDDGDEPFETPSETPENTEAPETHTASYGGIPMRNILAFMLWFSEQDGVTISQGYTQEEADALLAEMWELESKDDDAIIEWFDRNIIGAEEYDYNGYTQDEIDDARNMTIVLMAGMTEYVPNEIETWEEFLTDKGMAIMERWRAKLANAGNGNDSGENPPESTPPGGESGNGNTQNPTESQNPGGGGTGGGTGTNGTPPTSGGSAYGTKDSARYSNKSVTSIDNGNRIRITFTVQIPELAGTESMPYVVVLFYNPDGTVRDYQTCTSTYITDKDTASGWYTFTKDFTPDFSLDEVRGYVYLRYIPSDERVADFMQIPMNECTQIL